MPLEIRRPESVQPATFAEESSHVSADPVVVVERWLGSPRSCCCCDFDSKKVLHSHPTVSPGIASSASRPSSSASFCRSHSSSAAIGSSQTPKLVQLAPELLCPLPVGMREERIVLARLRRFGGFPPSRRENLGRHRCSLSASASAAGPGVTATGPLSVAGVNNSDSRRSGGVPAGVPSEFSE